MMNPTKIAEQAATLTLEQAREIKSRLGQQTSLLLDAEWETLIAAERVLAKAGELQYASYNED